MFDTFSFSQRAVYFVPFINTEREKRMFEMFSSCPKPSDFVLVWPSCIVNRVFVGVQIAGKVP